GWHFLQGKKTNPRQHWKGIGGAAATIVEGERLTLNLVGARGRSYHITIPLPGLEGGENRTTARMQYGRRTFQRPCLSEFLFAHRDPVEESGFRSATALSLRPNRIRYYVRLFLE